jgi:Ca-activated chloride channel family protein
MSFHWPYVLLALPLTLAVLLALFFRSYRARLRLLTQFAAARLLPALMASYSPNLRRLKHSLIIFGVLLVVFALARPQWGYDWQEQRAKGVDVIFVIDTSKSMLTQDVAPDRLERAKLAIMDLVEKMPGNRVGLVAFAGQAFLQCPLTLDYDAFRQSLDAVDTTTIARGGTNIAAGLDEAAAALENSGNHKVVVLLSDGEDLEGQGVDTAKTLGAENVTVFTVGVGTPQGDIIPLPAKDGQVDFVRDENGQIVKSRLDAATLTAIAQSTGGFYQPLGATGEGLVKVYEAGIKPMPQEQVASRLQRLPIERFQWPLALGLLLLAIEPLIGTRRLFRADERRRAALAALPVLPPERKSPAKAAAPVAVALLIAAVGMIPSPRAHAQSPPASTPIAPDTASPAAPTPPVSTSSTPPAAQPASDSSSPTTTPSTASSPPPSAPSSPVAAENLFKQGDYKAAAQAYGEAAEAAPQDGRFRYDQAASLYRSGDYAGAAQAFQQTLSANDLNLQQHAYYGLGNAHYRQGQAELQQDPKQTVSTWESAAKDYKNALELNPGDTDATYNLNLVNQELEALKKQLEQQQKQQQQQQNQQNQQNQPDQQNQNNSQQNQQNQSQQQNQNGQQNQQQSQNQQGQQNQQQNQNGQQGQQQQQQNGGQSQSQQNQQGQQGQQGQPQNQTPGHTGATNQNQGQQQNPSQNQGQNQNQQSQPKPNPGQNGEPKQPQPGTQGQNQNPQTTPNGQPKPANQGQPNQPNQNAAQTGEPGAQKPGQQSGASGAAAAASGTDKNAPNGNATVSIPGVMTQEEAGQVLDSLKDSERKLPMNNYDAQKEGAQEPPDKTFRDW